MELLSQERERLQGELQEHDTRIAGLERELRARRKARRRALHALQEVMRLQAMAAAKPAAS